MGRSSGGGRVGADPAMRGRWATRGPTRTGRPIDLGPPIELPRLRAPRGRAEIDRECARPPRRGGRRRAEPRAGRRATAAAACFLSHGVLGGSGVAGEGLRGRLAVTAPVAPPSLPAPLPLGHRPLRPSPATPRVRLGRHGLRAAQNPGSGSRRTRHRPPLRLAARPVGSGVDAAGWAGVAAPGISAPASAAHAPARPTAAAPAQLRRAARSVGRRCPAPAVRRLAAHPSRGVSGAGRAGWAGGPAAPRRPSRLKPVSGPPFPSGSGVDPHRPRGSRGLWAARIRHSGPPGSPI